MLEIQRLIDNEFDSTFCDKLSTHKAHVKQFLERWCMSPKIGGTVGAGESYPNFLVSTEMSG
jgi:hypothetical protein